MCPWMYRLLSVSPQTLSRMPMSQFCTWFQPVFDGFWMTVPLGLLGEILCLSPENWYEISYSGSNSRGEETNWMYGGNCSFGIFVLLACGNKYDSCELLEVGLFRARGFVFFLFCFITLSWTWGSKVRRWQILKLPLYVTGWNHMGCCAAIV